MTKPCGITKYLKCLLGVMKAVFHTSFSDKALWMWIMNIETSLSCFKTDGTRGRVSEFNFHVVESTANYAWLIL